MGELGECREKGGGVVQGGGELAEGGEKIRKDLEWKAREGWGTGVREFGRGMRWAGRKGAGGSLCGLAVVGEGRSEGGQKVDRKIGQESASERERERARERE